MNRRLTIEARDGEIVTEHSIGSAGELGQILEETFKMTPPVPVDEIFNRLGS
jgi:hypothetical protein